MLAAQPEFLKGGDERGMAVTCNNLGFLYKDKEQWEEADGYFRRSLELFTKMGDEHGMTISLNNLGLLYKDKGEWDKAIERFLRSLEILERAARGMAATCSDLGFLYKDKGQWKEADKYFQRGLEILDTMGDEHGKAAIFTSLGFCTRQEGWQRQTGTGARSRLKKIGDEQGG
jgi:tetratricopeptide (TPR) repeat protein